MATGPSICGAITNTFAADTGAGSLMASVPSGLWVGEVPEEYALPMVALIHRGERPSYTTGITYREEGLVEFRVIAAGLANCEALAARLKKVFDPTTTVESQISVVATGAESDSFRRQDYVVSRLPMRTPDDVPVFQVSMPYTAWTDRRLVS